MVPVNLPIKNDSQRLGSQDAPNDVTGCTMVQEKPGLSAAEGPGWGATLEVPSTRTPRTLECGAPVLARVCPPSQSAAGQENEAKE